MTIASTSPLSAALTQFLHGRAHGHHGQASSPAIGSSSTSTQGSGLASTILQALSQIGATSSSTGTSTATSSAGSSQAVQSFAQTLLATLKASGGGSLQQSLQGLIGELQSPNGTVTASGAGTTAAGQATRLATLQGSFNHLVSTLGGSSTNPAALGSFLNTLATDLSTPQATGQLVSVKA